jgi:beta-mannosidase
MLQLKSAIALICVLFFLTVNVAAQVSAQKMRLPLLAGWRFHEATKQEWHPAMVPGCVHTDLLANKLIEDPFYRDNEAKLQWIGKTDWDYQTTFVVTPEMLRRLNSELVFEGLDTYAEVSLNGTLILKADNMFRTWRVSVKNALKPGENVLAIHFRSPVNEILPVMAKMKYELPAGNDQGLGLGAALCHERHLEARNLRTVG